MAGAIATECFGGRFCCHVRIRLLEIIFDRCWFSLQLLSFRVKGRGTWSLEKIDGVSVVFRIFLEAN